MSISIVCPGCEQQGLVPNEAAGKKTRCPGCQTLILVPALVSKPALHLSHPQNNPTSAKTHFDDFLPEDENNEQDPYDPMSGIPNFHKPSAGVPMPIVLAIGGFVLAAIVLIGLFSTLESRMAPHQDGLPVLPSAQTDPDGSSTTTSSLTPTTPTASPRSAPTPSFNVKPNPPSPRVNLNLQHDPAPSKPEYFSGKIKVDVPKSPWGGYSFPTTPSQYMLIIDKSLSEDVWNIIDLKTGKPVSGISGKFSIREPYMLHPGGRYAAMKVDKPLEGIGVVDLASRKEMGLIPILPSKEGTPHRWGFEFDFGPNHLIYVYYHKEDFQLEVWDYQESKRVGAIPMGDAPGIGGVPQALSPGRKYLALGLDLMKESEIRVVDLETVKVVGAIPISTMGMEKTPTANAKIKGLAFSNDGLSLSCLYQATDSPPRGKHFIRTWSIQGQVESDHLITFDKDLEDHLLNKQDLKLCFLPNDEGWFVYGHTLFDRKTGQSLWIIPNEQNQAEQPRRIIDSYRVLIPIKLRELSGPVELRSIELPKEKVEAALALARRGGHGVDANAPALVKPDLSQARVVGQKLISRWSAEPDSYVGPGCPTLSKMPIELSHSGEELERVFFSSPESAQALVVSSPYGDPLHDDYDKVDSEAYASSFQRETKRSQSRRFGGGGSPDARTISRANLLRGLVDVTHEIPLGLKVAAMSPSGNQILVLDSATRSRLDIYEIAKLNHFCGVRPYEHLAKDQLKSVVWADFLADNKIYTLNSAGTLITWSIPDFKALSITELGVTVSGQAQLSPGKKQLAIAGQDRVVLADCLSGDILGSVRVPRKPYSKFRFSLGFRPDGAELAVGLEKGCGVINVATGQLDIHPDGPGDVEWIQYCGKYFILLNNERLFDLVKKKIIWNYSQISSNSTNNSIDGDHWYVKHGSILERRKGRLIRKTVPHPELVDALKRVTEPTGPLVLQQGDSVSLQVEVQGHPGDAEQFRKKVETRFKKRCSELGYVFRANSPKKITMVFHEKAMGFKFPYYIMPKNQGFGVLNLFGDGDKTSKLGLQTVDIDMLAVDVGVFLDDGAGPRITIFQGLGSMPAESNASKENMASELRKAMWGHAESVSSTHELSNVVRRADGQGVTLPGYSGWTD